MNFRTKTRGTIVGVWLRKTRRTLCLDDRLGWSEPLAFINPGPERLDGSGGSAGLGTSPLLRGKPARRRFVPRFSYRVVCCETTVVNVNYRERSDTLQRPTNVSSPFREIRVRQDWSEVTRWADRNHCPSEVTRWALYQVLSSSRLFSDVPLLDAPTGLHWVRQVETSLPCKTSPHREIERRFPVFSLMGRTRVVRSWHVTWTFFCRL